MIRRTLLAASLLWSSAPFAEGLWHQETVLAGLPVNNVHGLHGLTFGPDGGLYVGSVMGQTIVRLDIETGVLTTTIPAPLGEADDVAFGPDGHLAWTALNAGEVRLRNPDGTITTVAADLPFINPIRFAQDGTLYAATPFGPDRLWQFDLDTGERSVVTEDVGGLNGFVFGKDGRLYTPLPMRQAVSAIDVRNGDLEVIAENIGNIVAVTFHPDGLLYGASWDDGQIVRIDPLSGWTETVAVVTPPLDNLAAGPDGLLYVSRSADNGVIAVDPVSGSQRVVLRSELAAPGGLTWITRDGQRQLLVTDIFGYRFFDPATGTVSMVPFDLERGASSDADARDGLLALTYVRRNRALLIDQASGDVLHTWMGLPAPYSVLLDDAGALIVADYNDGTIIRLTLDDPEARTVITSDLSGPVGLAWAELDRSIFVAEAGNGSVVRVALDDGRRQTIASGLDQPETLAVMVDERIAVTEVGKQRVIAVEPDTGAMTVLADSLPLGGPISRAPAPVAMPTGLAVDDDGSVYVVTDANNGLIKLTPD